MAIDFDGLAEKLRNWGRWGPEDQRGTLNFIDPAALKRGASAVKQGRLLCVGLNYDCDGPQQGGGRINPLRTSTAVDSPLGPPGSRASYADDVITMFLQAATQWDSYAHVHYDGLMYNGFKVCDHLNPGTGASRCGIEHLARPGISSRGVFLDIARMKGVDILPNDYAITPDDMNAACEKYGVKIEPGDILLVRTGQIRRFTLEKDRAAFNGLQSGLSPTVAEWMHDKSIAAVTADNMAVEILRAEPDPAWGELMPLHMLTLRDMGMPLGEIFDFEELSVDCARDGQYDFLFSAPPLPVTGGFGSPLNPQVIK
jgi:kynurenine formamidase